MTAAQLESLAAIDAHIDVCQSIDNQSVWEESALYSHPFWEEHRKKAIHSLSAFS